MPRILVTGGTGYIGSHTCVALLNAGYDVTIADNLSNSELSVVDRIGQIAGRSPVFSHIDLCSQLELCEIFKQQSFDAVIHFAGLKAVNESVTRPLRYYRNNLEATLALLEVMNEFDVRKLVFSSSANVYGVPDRLPILENFSRHPTNPYGKTKMMIEDILGDLYASDERWSMSLLRYFNPVGAHQSGLIGESPKGVPNNLMPYLAKVAAGRLPYLHVYGDDYPTPDGTGVRDFIHVMDLAEGHVSALQWQAVSPGLAAFNLGTGEGHSVLEMISTFERVSGKKIPYKVEGRRPGDVAVSYADCSLAQRSLSWKAKRNLETMCEDEWRWQTSQFSTMA